MAGYAKDIRLGACWVTFGGVDLGYTKGGVVLTIDTSTHEILVDQEGETPVGEVITGRRCTVMVPMAQTDYSKLVDLIPDSEYSDGKLEISSGIGDDLMDYADELILTAKNNVNDKVTVYKAAPVANLQATYLPANERVWPVQFKGYIPSADEEHAGVILGLEYAT